MIALNQNQYRRLSELRLKIKHGTDGDFLEDVKFTAPFKITKPFYDAENNMKIMMLSISAGIMEGDSQEIEIEVGENARAEITSQSFEKIHRMKTGSASRHTKLTVKEGGMLIYNPLPTIPFADSAFKTDTDIYLTDTTSKLIYGEVISCGRVGMDEKFLYRFYKALTKVYQGDEPIYYDNAQFVPSKANLEGFCMFEGYTHLSNMIIVNFNDNESLMSGIRNYISENTQITGGCSVSGNLLCVRMLANGAEELTRMHDKITQYVLENTPKGESLLV